MRATVHIRILDDVFETNAEDSVLFALQRYAQARHLPVYGFARFCWNTSCRQCVVRLRQDGTTSGDYACQAPVHEDLEVLSVPRVLHWKARVLARLKSE